MSESSNIQQHAGDNAALLEQRKKLEKALHYFRVGDLTAWNYTILALAFVALFFGIFLLARNIFINKKKKMIALYMKNAAQAAEADGKQAVLQLEKDTESPEDTPLKQELQPGDIEVKWNDGQVVSLFRNVPEADV